MTQQSTQHSSDKDIPYSIRLATRADVGAILSLIRELAAYENLSHEVVADEASLAHSLFGQRPYAEALIAESEQKPLGFAVFFHSFSTFLGKPCLYLEDMYVKPESRGSGLGRQFFRELAVIAKQRDCGRMEWSVLDWNEPAIAFYRKLGARPMEGWTVQRLTRNEIDALAD